MSTHSKNDPPRDVTALLEQVISLINEDLGGAPAPEHLTPNQGSLTTLDLVNRVRAMVRLRTFLNGMINAEATLAVERGASYAVIGKAAGVSKSRAHQLWPRPELFPDDGVFG
jgi:hypothetical protein